MGVGVRVGVGVIIGGKNTVSVGVGANVGVGGLETVGGAGVGVMVGVFAAFITISGIVKLWVSTTFPRWSFTCPSAV